MVIRYDLSEVLERADLKIKRSVFLLVLSAMTSLFATYVKIVAVASAACIALSVRDSSNGEKN